VPLAPTQARAGEPAATAGELPSVIGVATAVTVAAAKVSQRSRINSSREGGKTGDREG